MGVISELLKCDWAHWWVHTGVSKPPHDFCQFTQI